MTPLQKPHLDYRLTLGIVAMEGRGFEYPSDSFVAENDKIYVTNKSRDYGERGVRVTILDMDSDYFAELIPVYEVMPGWSESTFAAKRFDDLPQAAKNYIRRLEELVETRIDIISTGPDRVETIVLNELISGAI